MEGGEGSVEGGAGSVEREGAWSEGRGGIHLRRRTWRMRRRQRAGDLARSCSQRRTTFQPWRRRVRVTNRSRAMLARSLSAQKTFPVRRPGLSPRACRGVSVVSAIPIELFFNHFFGLECFGHPCQKQPSTKSARRCLGKTKSGRTRTAERSTLNRTVCCRRQPVIWWARSSFASASSVSLLPRLRMCHQ